jgi:hypothetical protein
VYISSTYPKRNRVDGCTVQYVLFSKDLSLYNISATVQYVLFSEDLSLYNISVTVHYVLLSKDLSLYNISAFSEMFCSEARYLKGK